MKTQRGDHVRINYLNMTPTGTVIDYRWDEEDELPLAVIRLDTTRQSTVTVRSGLIIEKTDEVWLNGEAPR